MIGRVLTDLAIVGVIILAVGLVFIMFAPWIERGRDRK